MTTLTETARVTKVGFKYVVVFLAVLMVGQMLLSWLIRLYKTLNPPAPLPATMGFGVLPAIEFPKKEVGQLSYKLETVDGTVASFGPTAKVFLVEEKKPTLLGLDRGKQRAAAMGFVFEPQQISGSLYRWSKSQPLLATLELDYAKENFEMSVSWQNDPGFLNVKLIPTEAQTVMEAKDFLKRSGSLPEDMAAGVVRVTNLKYTGGRLTAAVSLSEADMVRVDLYRESVDGVLPVLPADPDQGVARVIVSGSRDQGERFVYAWYKHTQVDYENYQTYPLIGGQEAWEKLTRGEGFVARTPKTGSEAVVREVSLGYFDSLDGQKYLQPIYVFSGDEGLVAYVPAVAAATTGQQ